MESNNSRNFHGIVVRNKSFELIPGFQRLISAAWICLSLEATFGFALLPFGLSEFWKDSQPLPEIGLILFVLLTYSVLSDG